MAASDSGCIFFRFLTSGNVYTCLLPEPPHVGEGVDEVQPDECLGQAIGTGNLRGVLQSYLTKGLTSAARLVAASTVFQPEPYIPVDL